MTRRACGMHCAFHEDKRARGALTLLAVFGVWPDVDGSYKNDKEAPTTCAIKFPDQVYAVTVGSETLYRGNFTGPELLANSTTSKPSFLTPKSEPRTAGRSTPMGRRTL